MLNLLPTASSSAIRATMSLFAAMSLSAVLLLCSCDKGSGAPTKAARAAGQPPVPVAAANARTGPIASYYETTATLEEERRAIVPARISGLVKSIKVEEGDLVKAGEPLLVIEDQEYRFRLEKASATVENLESKVARMKEIEGVVSAEAFETAQNDFTTAQAEQALARLSLSYATVTAPFDGRITRRFVDEGQMVGPESTLFSVSDFDPLLARVFVPAKEGRKVKEGQNVRLTLDSDGKELDGPSEAR